MPAEPFGFLCCDKPVGMTSRDAVNIVAGCLRRASGGKKVKLGHAGTLDPLAQGVLVMAVGRAARLVPYVQRQSKYYRATFILGQSTVSGDLEGEVTVRDDLPMPDLRQLKQAAERLTGTIQQIPPAHSAIRIGGKRAYQLARAGQDVQVPVRSVQIHRLEITRFSPPEVELDICCGSGTYVRTLGMDLAKQCGSVAVMSYLRRYAVGVFHESASVSIDTLRDADPLPLLRPATDGVHPMQRVDLNDDQALRLTHGLELDLDSIIGTAEIQDTEKTTSEAAAIWRDRLLAIVHRHRVASDQYSWLPKKVFLPDQPIRPSQSTDLPIR